MAKAGVLITFEGGEGAGKSTQLARLARRLAAAGLEVVSTREPGGTPGAEAVRALVVEGGVGRWLPSTELLLMAAARDDHLARLVRPALARGAWVLCDRFTNSTLAYQGHAGGVGEARIRALHGQVMAVPEPDLTLLLDLPPAQGMARRRAAGAATRFEAKDAAFHEAVRAGFLALARAEPHRIRAIDAAGGPGEVEERIRMTVAERFGLSIP